MQPDDRLRMRLRRLEAPVEPDLDQQLVAVVERADRRGRRTAAGSTMQILAVTAAAVAIAVAAFTLRGTPPAGRPLTLQSNTWTTTLSASDSTVAREGLGGTWTIRFEPSGGITLTTPPTYLAPTTGYRYRVTGDQIAIGLFVERCLGVGPGDYTFAFESDALRFTVVQDSCPHRATLLSTQSWQPAARR
jgi:hypothetical protein